CSKRDWSSDVCYSDLNITEFKNFPYRVNNFIIDQSILTLTSVPIPTSMKDINTTELTDITIAHRDLNKGQWEKFENSNSSVLIEIGRASCRKGVDRYS